MERDSSQVLCLLLSHVCSLATGDIIYVGGLVPATVICGGAFRKVCYSHSASCICGRSLMEMEMETV